MRRISIIVPARNAAGTLPALLDALDALHKPAGAEVEVLLCDDGSSDDTARIAREHRAGARVITNPGRGPAAARNAAATQANGDVLAFTDADCVPTERWLLVALAALDEGADLVQGAVSPPPGEHVGPFDRTVRVGQPTQLFETANIVIRRDLFERLGGFESWLGAATGKELGEDAWLGWRAIRGGARFVFAADAVVHHAVHPGTAATFVKERTRLRFFPLLVARIPELRTAFCHRRYFLSARTARFDLAAAAVAVAAITRRRWPLLAAAPYAVLVVRIAAVWGPRRGPAVAAANVVADAVGAAALAQGSVRARTPLL